MQENIRLYSFLKNLGRCSGDEAIDLISRFQSGGLTVEWLSVYDFDYEKTYQYREIDEGGWVNCSKKLFEHYDMSALYDTRILTHNA